MKYVVMFLVLVCVPAPALAWLDNGHMAIARFTWQKLSDAQRRQSAEILKRHPHYEEFLAAERPVDVAADEWAFMRAAVWPDFVRETHADQYNKPSWHYISMGYVPGYSKVTSPAGDPPSPNAVTQIEWAAAQLQSQDQAEAPVALCWLLHLIGDIHQPNHAISLYNEDFPQGDRGGNLALIRVDEAESIRLHLYWDGLLGQLASMPGIERLGAEFAEIEKTDAAEIDRLLTENATPLSWAQESFAAGKKYAYIDGSLRPANNDLHPREDNVPRVSAEYVKQAAKTARLRAVLAARRTASTLSKSLAPPAGN